MAEVKFTNNYGTINGELLEQLEKKIKKWQDNRAKDNLDVAVDVEINKTTDSQICDINFHPFVYGALSQIKNGAALDSIRYYIDSVIGKYKDELDNKVKFEIYIYNKEHQQVEENKNENVKKRSNEDTKFQFAATAITPKYKMEQLILPEDTKEEIDSVLSLLKCTDKIYNQWGFIEIDPIPRTIVNFWGPAGTGKTMTVHAIANQMGKKVLIVNYSDIESKYAGEAPKNLLAAFETATKEDAVLFFDEADSFLGKRITNVDNSSAQAINSLRSQMLMKLEEFNGIVFFATNLHENYDRAFESRILKHIEFKLPNQEARKAIIKSKLPKKAPYSEDVYSNETFNEQLMEQLSTIIDGFSGREIKNCCLEALVTAAKQDSEVTSDILRQTFTKKKQEFDKIGQEEKLRNEKLGSTIKEKLNKGDYKVIKGGQSENEETINEPEEENEDNQNK